MATKKVNIDIIARDKSQQALNKVRGNLDGVKASVFNVRNALVGIGGGLAVRSLVKTGMEIESLQVRLKFLFGTAEEGAKAFDNMAKFASKVPFSLEQIQQGAGVLSVISKDADELSDIMEITGNVAAVTGLDFRTASEQIQRSLSAGIASADLFRERGVRDLLGFKAGATVTAEETAEAFKRVFGKGGQFGGATDELAKTFEGTLSMIGDKFFTFKKTILEAGFFPELKKQFGDLNKFLEDNGTVIDDVAKKIGVGLALAVEKVSNGFKFLKENFDAVVLVLQTMVAIKVATFFYGMTMALNGLTVAMTGFNIATKRNIIFGSLTVFASAMGFMIHKFKEFKGELDVGSMSLKELNEQINAIENKKAINSLENYRAKASDFAEMNAKLLILEEERTHKLKAHHQAMGKSMQQMRDSVALGYKQNENTKQEIKNEKERIDQLIKRNFLQDRMKDEQIGMSDRDKDNLERIKENEKEKQKIREEALQEEVAQELARLENINAILEQNKLDGIAIFYEMQAEKERIINESKILEINNENEKAKELREINKNNFHKMLDDASEFHSKKAQLEKQAKEHAISEGRSALEILSGMNRTAFQAFKAVRIAEATIDTYRAATAAFAKFGGFPLGALAAAASVAKGLALVAQIKSTNFRAGGGAVNKDQPYMVGEKGPEMFVPSGSGKIVPNNQLASPQPVNVNFSINTVDARGVDELLTNRRSTIINVINDALNSQGKEALV